MAYGGPPLSKPPARCELRVRSLQVDLASGDERAMHGEVLEFAGLGEPVSLAQCAEVVAAGERFEDVLCRASIDQDDPVRRSEADVEAHPCARDLFEHRVVAAQKLVGIAVK